MKKVCITGANGFIGGELAKLLLSKGVIVYGIGKNIKCRADLQQFSNYFPIEASFEDYCNIEKNINEKEFDVFYHFAWAGGFESSALKNYKLQLNNAVYAAEALNLATKLCSKRFVYAETNNLFEIMQFLDDFNNHQPRGTCIYASAKVTAELICRTLAEENGLIYNSGIIPMVYGVGNLSKQLMNVAIAALLRGESPKLIEGNNQYDIVSVKDVARAFYLIGEKGIANKRYWVGNRTIKTFKEWMILLGQIVNPKVVLKFGQYKDPLNINYSQYCLDDLYNDTGYECEINFQDGIRENVEWLRESNLLANF